MAFRHSDLGPLVANNPAEAHARLSAAFIEHSYSLNKVADAFGVNKTTVHRWCKTLEDKGYGDPRRKPESASTQPRDGRTKGPVPTRATFPLI